MGGRDGRYWRFTAQLFSQSVSSSSVRDPISTNKVEGARKTPMLTSVLHACACMHNINTQDKKWVGKENVTHTERYPATKKEILSRETKTDRAE